ncbi:MAG: hypothetical protein N4A70_03960 [Pelagimonas sp.]|jgi:hypothetical protein|nr:hypothetical protein [Pelagimonas sp.]
MPLHILIALVVIGISGVALLTHLLGMSQPHRFDSDRDARDAWLREFPEIDIRSVSRCQSGTAALIDTVQGPGLVWPMGQDTTARLITGASYTASGDRLTLHLPDYAAPKVQLRLTQDEIRSWTQTISEAA